MTPTLEIWSEAKGLLRQERYAEAVARFEEAIRLDPSIGDLHDDLAFCLSRLGDHQRAIDCSWNAVAANPEEPRFYSNLGARYLRVGDTPEAEWWGKKAYALDPKFKSAQVLLRTLEPYGAARKREEPEVYGRCLQAVMDTPDLVDAVFDLHRPGQWPASGELRRGLAAIDRTIGGSGSPEAHDATEVYRHAGDLIQFVKSEARWSAALLEEARERFPIREFGFDFEEPAGFRQPRGWYFRWERRRLGLLAKLTPPGRRLPVITIHRPQRTFERYPWQQAISGNQFLWNVRGRRLGSRYVRLAGTVQFEMSFAAGDDPWMELPSGRITSLQRIVIPLVVSGDREYRIMAAAEKLDDVRPAFDRILETFS